MLSQKRSCHGYVGCSHPTEGICDNCKVREKLYNPINNPEKGLQKKISHKLFPKFLKK